MQPIFYPDNGKILFTVNNATWRGKYFPHMVEIEGWLVSLEYTCEELRGIGYKYLSFFNFSPLLCYGTFFFGIVHVHTEFDP